MISPVFAVCRRGAQPSRWEAARFRRRRARALAAWVVLGLGSAVAGYADVLWLQPDAFTATPSSALFISATSAEEFGSAKDVLNARVAGLSARLAGASLPVPTFGGASTQARFVFALFHPGFAVFTLDLQPELRRFASAGVEHYLRTMHATDSVRDAWSGFPAGSAWREQRTVRLKTWVRVGTPPADDQAWSEPSDGRFDLVFATDPSAVHDGQRMPVRILLDKQPLAGVVVSFLSQGETREHVVISDTDGCAAAPLDAKGLWLVQANAIRRVQAVDRDWDVDIVAVTIAAK